MVWTGFVWLRIETSGRFVKMQKKTFSFQNNAGKFLSDRKTGSF
jgi:hypothetical protein